MALDLSGLDKFSSLLDASPADASGVREIPIDQIDADPDQPRKDFDQGKLMELADSMKAHGVIQPVVVRSVGNRFQLIAGERRWRAAGLAGLASVSAIVRDDLTARAQMVENLQREDLSTFEIYRVIAAELDGGTSQKELAGQYGKSKQWISDYATVAKMPPSLQDALRDGRASDISALVALSRLFKQAPAQVEQLAESGTPITRHQVNQLADSLARRASGVDASTGSVAAGDQLTKPKAGDKQHRDRENNDEHGTHSPSDNLSSAADSGSTDSSQQPGASNSPLASAPQNLPVGIKVHYEGDTFWLRYDRPRDKDGRCLLMIANDTNMSLYAPLSELVIVAIYPHHTKSFAES